MPPKRFLALFGGITIGAAVMMAFANGYALTQSDWVEHPIQNVLLLNIILAGLTLVGYSLLFQRFTGYYPLADIDAATQQRQTRLLALLRQTKSPIPLPTLAQKLGVSLATVSGDVYDLVRHGSVQKLPCGVGLPTMMCPEVKSCEFGKHKAVADAMFIIEAKPTDLYACCAKSGMLLLQSMPEQPRILTRDFLYGHTIDARHAMYLVDSDIESCVVAVSTQENAQRLQRGFAGHIVDFDELTHIFKENEYSR